MHGRALTFEQSLERMVWDSSMETPGTAAQAIILFYSGNRHCCIAAALLLSLLPPLPRNWCCRVGGVCRHEGAKRSRSLQVTVQGCCRIRGLAPPDEPSHLQTIGSLSCSPSAADLGSAPAWQGCTWRMACSPQSTPARTCTAGCSSDPRMLGASWREHLQVPLQLLSGC